MSKDHEGHSHSLVDTKSLGVAFLLNFVFTVIEIIGALWSNSTAILADAVHDLGDSLALGSAWYLERFSAHKGDDRFSFGYRRFSLLGVVLNTAVLSAGAVIVLTRAVPRLFDPEPANAPVMLGFAVLGIIINGAAVLRLRNRKGLNARVVFWHLLEDVLGWAAILLVGIVLMFRDFYILDPLLSILITAYVLIKIMGNFKSTLKIFLQAVPEGINLTSIENALQKVPGVCKVHHAHIWSLDGLNHIFSARILLEKNEQKDEMIAIKNEIRSILNRLGIKHNTIELEYPGEECDMDSDMCRPNGECFDQ